MLAATDLTHDDGVLRRGAEYARRLGVPLILVHNVVPVMRALSSEGDETVIVEPRASLLAAQHEALLTAATELDSKAARFVVSRAACDDAILEIARRHRAELIAVGAGRSPKSSPPRPRIADRIIAARARLSVLVVPTGCST